MIKYFDYMFGNEMIVFCVSFGVGLVFCCVFVSCVDLMEMLVVFDVCGLLGLLKVVIEELEGLFDDVICKVGDE